jgi:hypothetical protein
MSDLYVDASGALHAEMINDAQSVFNDWLKVSRSGAVPSAVNLYAPVTIGGTATAGLTVTRPALTATLQNVMVLGESTGANPRQATFDMSTGTGRGVLNIEMLQQGIGEGALQLLAYGGGAVSIGAPGATGGDTQTALYGSLAVKTNAAMPTLSSPLNTYALYFCVNDASPLDSYIIGCGDGGSRGRVNISCLGPGGLSLVTAATFSDSQVVIDVPLNAHAINIGGNFITAGQLVGIDNIQVNPATGGYGVYLNWANSGTGVIFGNGAGGNIGSISNTGLLSLGGVTTITANSNLILNPASATNVLLNWTGGGAGVIFGDGAGNNVAQIPTTGVLTCLGLYAGAGGVLTVLNGVVNTWGELTCNAGLNVVGGSKNFRITHPLDPTKHLTHSCLEGPEIAVFYRGEGVTARGACEVVLPDYFEALTRSEGRTVQLTIKVDDDAPKFGGALAAGSVRQGRFKVYSVDFSVAFYWEVKAVRADIDPLAVVTDLSPTVAQYNAKEA